MRISSGNLKGRIVDAPKGLNTRPTSSRLRQALFEHLVHARLQTPIEECTVLDLFAGSGAFAIEAISRGAIRATLVENNTAALRCIRANIQKLGIEDQCQVVAHALPGAVRKLSPRTPFNLVFADPPYASEDAIPTLERLLEGAPLESGALIVYEHDRRRPVARIGSVPAAGHRDFGDTRITFFQLP
jgi:16S rRNA (guanine966-N2)-methyltransferase